MSLSSNDTDVSWKQIANDSERDEFTDNNTYSTKKSHFKEPDESAK